MTFSKLIIYYNDLNKPQNFHYDSFDKFYKTQLVYPAIYLLLYSFPFKKGKFWKLEKGFLYCVKQKNMLIVIKRVVFIAWCSTDTKTSTNDYTLNYF